MDGLQVSLCVLGGINGANRSWVPLSCTGGTIRHEALIENSSDINPCFKRTVIQEEIVCFIAVYNISRI